MSLLIKFNRLFSILPFHAVSIRLWLKYGVWTAWKYIYVVQYAFQKNTSNNISFTFCVAHFYVFFLSQFLIVCHPISEYQWILFIPRTYTYKRAQNIRRMFCREKFCTRIVVRDEEKFPLTLKFWNQSCSIILSKYIFIDLLPVTHISYTKNVLTKHTHFCVTLIDNENPRFRPWQHSNFICNSNYMVLI